MLVDLMAIPWVDLRAKPRVDFTATWRFIGPGQEEQRQDPTQLMTGWTFYPHLHPIDGSAGVTVSWD